ncbi:MAG: hypothetical protein IPL25_19105 [Saprospiraceae bacterium]|nr:hypothetical protein [Candidatus Vicinibacter affinis]
MLNGKSVYNCGIDESCVVLCQQALALCDLDKDFPYQEIRVNDIKYRIALSKHRLGFYDEALEMYTILASKNSPMSSPLHL